MAEMDNFSELSENFDTIKTLLNSIRAQGILNTSDVDKLLSGINAKLEKINTEEDIDLIKIFLSELKQNLDERHGVLLSKLGAIESLFTNLLKNSSEMPKSSDIKELFDIVATNLSVFSREVVSQKDSLTDITLRLDALRSDDSQKKDIIKNITLLKPDLERLNNGFDSIVLSLNDNFKTIVKTISSIDKTEYLDRFSSSLNNIEMSSNTVLSALQMLDKKTVQVEDALHNLATKEDIATNSQKLSELKLQSQELSAVVTDISDRYVRIDNLADKVDASVSIIVGLKTALEDSENKHTVTILEQLRSLEAELKLVSSDTKFDDFKTSLTEVLKNIADNTKLLDEKLFASTQEIQRIINAVNDLDINVNFENLISIVNKVETDVKNSINEVSQKLLTLQDANVVRILNDINSSADSFGTRLNQTQSELAILCEKNFGSVFENIINLKDLLSQLEENNVSANNAIFSSITDRLTNFENNLSSSLETQERVVNGASAKLVEQIDNIKNLSNVLDYKIDSSVVEVGNIKKEFSNLQSAVEAVLALDFVNTVKDLRVDLYASKQELINNFEATENDLTEKITDELYRKYELLITKLDSVEDEFKRTQAVSLVELKTILDKIAASIVDVISYVSEVAPNNAENIDEKFNKIVDFIKENSMDYVEGVRDVVDVIRVQIENSLKDINSENVENFNLVKRSISENSEDIKKEIKYSYSKLIEIQDSYNEIKEIINVNNLSSSDKMSEVLAKAEAVRDDFDKKLITLKTALLDKITDFKQEFTCENADKVSELKFSVETLYNKNAQEVATLLENLKEQFNNLTAENVNSRNDIVTGINNNFESVKSLISELNKQAGNTLSEKIEAILEDFEEIKIALDKVDESIDGDLTRQLSIIESNFESLVSQITILFDKSDKTLSDKINEEFSTVSVQLQEAISDKLEDYKLKIEETFNGLQTKTTEQSKYLQERIADLNITFKQVLVEQAEESNKQVEEIALHLKDIIDDNIKLTAVDYVSLKNKLSEFAKNIENNNEILTQDLKAQMDDITKYINSLFDTQSQDIDVKNESLKDFVAEKYTDILTSINEIKDLTNEQLKDATVSLTSCITEKTTEALEATNEVKDLINNQLQGTNDLVSDKSSEIIELTSQVKDLAKEHFENTRSFVAEKSSEVIGETNVVKSLLQEQIEIANTSNADIEALTQRVADNKQLLDELKNALNAKVAELKTHSSEISADELVALNAYIECLKEQINTETQQIQICKDLIVECIKNEFSITSKNIEKETDTIIAELIEQFELLRKSQANDVITLTSRMEEIVNAHIYNNIEDLKSYLDIKTDNSVITSKLDNIKIEVVESFENVINDLNKLLPSDIFTSSIKDFRVANEVLVNSAMDRLNSKIEGFFSENAKDIEEKFTFFDKKFAETLVDKYEEIKLTINECNDSFNTVQTSIADVLSSFAGIKGDFNEKFDALVGIVKDATESTNKEVRLLSECFENLRSQISNKSFDEAFQASINKQIANLEALIAEQMEHIEEISDLCADNLPDVTELNTLVKHSILESIKQFSEKLDANNVEEQLNEVKSDIVTQMLNVFNQISFVAEEEEILDFIQEKHDELITILSHIVTSSAEVSAVKDNLSVVDTKIDSIKDEINLLNEKITAIMSADGDIDYVYSLQELETDIAGLRLVLNEMKNDGRSEEFKNLIASTNDIYSLVESVKSDIPTRREFEEIAEDIESISTRTNKLILASDESYKTLQDNLQDFKLVINDLDERTRNFAHESGIDRLDSKLNAINSMMQSGAKTNQIFNQVFEYLAEWVDNASTQINSISDKVENLNDIEQIKTMLTELKTGAEDNTESVELIEALGTVFDKQIKRINSLEAKLDKIIVETMVNNKIDLAPMENTLNKFLVAMDEKMISQQLKINSLEDKLQDVMNLLDEKDTAQLTKKVGGMDRQIAKLNKNLEKIASHVVEK